MRSTNLVRERGVQLGPKTMCLKELHFVIPRIVFRGRVLHSEIIAVDESVVGILSSDNGAPTIERVRIGDHIGLGEHPWS